MVYLCNQVLRESRSFKETFKTPKNPLDMKDNEIVDYFKNYGVQFGMNYRANFGIPRVIASPLEENLEGMEVRTGRTGKLVYFGPKVGRKIKKDEINSFLNDSHFENRYIKHDTYFNDVLGEAVKRGVITLCTKPSAIVVPFPEDKSNKLPDILVTPLLSDILDLQMQGAWERDDYGTREFLKGVDELYKKTKKSPRDIKFARAG